MLKPFEDRYTPEPMSGCWLWEEHVCIKGYGRIRYRGEKRQAHRVSWIIHRGEIPLGMNVLHKCDVTGCVNPDHLFLGTDTDNARDREQKKRGHNFKRGERRSQLPVHGGHKELGKRLLHKILKDLAIDEL